MILFRCLGCMLAILAFGEEGVHPKSEKATNAVIQAVDSAEIKQASAREKQATAAAAAAIDVVKSEGGEEIQTVPRDKLGEAREEAKQTFKNLKDAGIGNKAAADVAAKVVVAEVDGASEHKLDAKVKLDAEKAAVAAGTAVKDHPDNGAKALIEGVSNLEKQEGKNKVNVAEKGIIAKAGAAAKDSIQHPIKSTENLAINHTALLIIILGIAGLLWKLVEKQRGVGFETRSEYVEKLRSIRENHFQDNSETFDRELGQTGYVHLA